MSRWFRHYAGLCRDEKLVSVAIKSRQSIERVVWVWAAILESAAEIDDNGRYVLDAAEVAYFLRAADDDILAVEIALAAAGRVAEGAVVKWGNRQFRSDRSADRVAAHRERKRRDGHQGDSREASRDGAETLQERHCNSPELDTETDIPVANATGPATTPKPDLSPADLLWTDGVQALVTLGQREGQARSIIGKWLKNTGGDAGRVHWAIGEAERHGTGDPIPYITRVLSDRPTGPPQARQAPNRRSLIDALDRMIPDEPAQHQQFPRLAFGR